MMPTPYRLSGNPFAIAAFTQVIDDIAKAHLDRGCDPQDLVKALLLAAQRVSAEKKSPVTGALLQSTY